MLRCEYVVPVLVTRSSCKKKLERKKKNCERIARTCVSRDTRFFGARQFCCLVAFVVTESRVECLERENSDELRARFTSKCWIKRPSLPIQVPSQPVGLLPPPSLPCHVDGCWISCAHNCTLLFLFIYVFQPVDESAAIKFNRMSRFCAPTCSSDFFYSSFLFSSDIDIFWTRFF